MLNLKDKLKVIIFFSFLLILSAQMTVDSENVIANDEICSTFDLINKQCWGPPTNCFCEVVVKPEEN